MTSFGFQPEIQPLAVPRLVVSAKYARVIDIERLAGDFGNRVNCLAHRQVENPSGMDGIEQRVLVTLSDFFPPRKILSRDDKIGHVCSSRTDLTYLAFRVADREQRPDDPLELTAGLEEYWVGRNRLRGVMRFLDNGKMLKRSPNLLPDFLPRPAKRLCGGDTRQFFPLFIHIDEAVAVIDKVQGSRQLVEHTPKPRLAIGHRLRQRSPLLDE